MNRHLFRLLVAAGSMALATIPLAAPAQAGARSASSCPSGYLCAWSGTNTTGSMMKTRTNMPTMGSWNNKIRSYWNRTSRISCLFTDPNYGGSFFPDPPDNGISDYDRGLDKTISSIKFVPNERECIGPPYAAWYTQASPQPAGFGDLNGDGRADLLSRDRSGRLWFVSGTGDGTLISGGWNSMNALTRHGDLNGDGTEDLLARDTSGKLWLYPGTGHGTFGARKSLGSGWKSMATLTATGDLNSDGHGDLLARDTSGKLWLYPGTGHGTFGTRKLIGGGWGQISTFLSVGDVNGDGHLDLVAATQDGYNNPNATATANQMRLYAGNGRGTLARYELMNQNWYDLHGGF
ncbi:FG-GAP-like repeat-containing protein [Streptomyces sp. NPDC101152]|uniref:FG-GAP-like repeat-containing protein n=1 Tax=Streptomyces sp. NPDC101152 TaxID=3366116 RepID=UPI003812478C